jgi:hypothetical protein
LSWALLNKLEKYHKYLTIPPYPAIMPFFTC